MLDVAEMDVWHLEEKNILLLAAMAAVLMSMNMSCKPLNGSIGSRPTLEQRLDSLLDANYSASEPGISLLIAKDDEFGRMMQDMELKVRKRAPNREKE